MNCNINNDNNINNNNNNNNNKDNNHNNDNNMNNHNNNNNNNDNITIAMIITTFRLRHLLVGAPVLAPQLAKCRGCVSINLKG